MGQQQLLLVILVTIIVGIATVVAINTFGAAADNANLDAVRQDIAAMGTASQAFYSKPKMFGGGSRTFNGITMHNLAFSGIIVENDLGVNDNGTYEISAVDGQSLTIIAYASSETGYDGVNGPQSFTALITQGNIDIQ